MKNSEDCTTGQIQPYNSARDLPSFVEMEQQVRGCLFFMPFLGKKGRANLKEVRHELRRLPDIVDRFYERLGPRNWVFHDLLNVDLVESLLNRATTAEEAEREFIELYRDRDSMDSWLMHLRSMDGLVQRSIQIERAREHFFDDKFDSCTLHLLAVMDGFVNDFQPEVRKNLTARDPDDMAAWDSVVGHHMGLTHALKTFRKTIKRRIDEEVYELYRNGIVHGTVVRFDNIVVATKAWNMLFAVNDWATATLKSQEPEEPAPTLMGTLRQVRENELVKAKLEAWERREFSLDQDGFEELRAFQLTQQFLDAWKDKNYGNIARFDDRFKQDGGNLGQIAGEMRESFDLFELTDFTITEIVNDAPVVWLVRGEGIVDGEQGHFECRWLLQDEERKPVFDMDAAEWRLVFCSPTVWRKDQ